MARKKKRSRLHMKFSDPVVKKIRRELNINRSNTILQPFFDDKHCCFASYWQLHLKYIIKRLFLKFLLSENYADYFHYLNDFDGKIFSFNESLPDLYGFDAVYSTLAYTGQLKLDQVFNLNEQNSTYFHNLIQIQKPYLQHCPNRIDYLKKEYNKFFCSFFCVLRYITYKSNKGCTLDSLHKNISTNKLLVIEDINGIFNDSFVNINSMPPCELSSYIDFYGIIYHKSNIVHYDTILKLVKDSEKYLNTNFLNQYHKCDFKMTLNSSTNITTTNQVYEDKNFSEKLPVEPFLYDNSVSIEDSKYTNTPFKLKKNNKGLLNIVINDSTTVHNSEYAQFSILHYKKLTSLIGCLNQSLLTCGILSNVVDNKKLMMIYQQLSNNNNNNKIDKYTHNIFLSDKYTNNPPYFPGTMNCPHYKYYLKRYELFSLFDYGIKLDQEGWYSVTPENIAMYIAERLSKKFNFVVDCFSGCGGNAIQFAKFMDNVVAIEIDGYRLDCAKTNAQIYGVQDKITFIHGDFFEKLTQEYANKCIYVAPPWGGIDFSKYSTYNIQLLLHDNGYEMISKIFSISSNVCMCLPRNIDISDIFAIAQIYKTNVDIEYNYMDDRLVMTTAYFGDTYEC